MKNEINKFIDDYQKEKSGIYPHQVAMLVSSKFGLKEKEAVEFVTEHIKRVIVEGQ